MTLEDIINNKERLRCYWCLSNIAHGDGKFIALMGQEGVIVIKGREGKPEPMVFCSSDCMVYDCNQRYLDRVSRGAFRKEFNQKYNDSHQLPNNWKDEGHLVMKGENKKLEEQSRELFESHR